MTDNDIINVMEEYAETVGKAVREKYSTGEDSFDRQALLKRINAKRRRKPVYGGLAACAAVVLLVFAGGLTGQLIPYDNVETKLVQSSVNYDYSVFPRNGHIYLPRILPQNIKVKEYSFVDSIFTIRYSAGNTTLTFSQGNIDIKEDIDIMERVSVNGSGGYLLEAKGGYNQLIWQKEATTFVLVGNFKEDTLVSIAESVG